MSRTIDYSAIALGDDVVGADNEKVGKIAEVQPNYVVVEKGFFFPTDYYVPMSAIATVQDGRVYLNVSRDVALQSGWDVPPLADAMSADMTTVGTYDSALASEDRLVGDYAAPAATIRETDDEIHVPVVQEELTATVRPVQAGSVRIEKDVVAEERTLEVPVTEERIRVERRIVDRPVAAADANVLEETVIEVPLYAEEVDLQKRARVAEEVVISKEAVQRTEQVSGTVRREEVIVDEGNTSTTEVTSR